MRCVPCSSMRGYSRVAAEALSIQLGFSCRIDTASTVMDCTTGIMRVLLWSAECSGRNPERAWGRRQRTARGGRALARRALDHLRRIAPLGVRTKAMNRMTRDEQIAFAVSDMARMRGHPGHE